MESVEKYYDQKLWLAIYDINSKLGASAIFSKIETLADVFAAFLKHGDDFYDYIEVNSEKESDMETDEVAILLLDSYITQLYLNLPAMILYLRRQEPEYIEYMKEVLIPALLPRLAAVTGVDKEARHKIYASEIPDKINDAFLTLRYSRYVFENLDELVHSEKDPLELLRDNEDYNWVSFPRDKEGFLTFQFDKVRGHMDEIREEMERLIVAFQANNMQFEKITWLGTSTELAYLFEQLAYRGYIENPQTKDGEMNKTALAREIWTHIAPRDVKEETFIVDMRGSRLSENSTFAKAMNSIPNNTKNK